jgi:hypothetical protein
MKAPSYYVPVIALGALSLLAASAAPPTPAAAPELPPLAPLPAPLAKRMPDLVQTAERYRGLSLVRRVPWGVMSEGDLAREVADDFRQDLPPERLAAVELSLKTFGLIPEVMDLKTYYPRLLTSEIAGFYDSHRKVLALVDHQGGLFGQDAVRQFGADTVHQMEDGLLAHELTHALQDQHFDLDRLDDPDPMSDSGVAHLALIEGDASIVMLDALVQVPIENVPEAPAVLAKFFGAASGDTPGAGGAGLPGEAEMADAPPWLRDMLLFSYTQGAAFCLDVRRRGGQRLLDYAFGNDPPRSSEQILHPEKWYGHRDDPVVIVWPELSAALPGYAKAAEGQLGEEGIRVLLKTALHDAAAADTAAAGWGGDRFAVYLAATGASGRLLAWITDWDTAQDATEFQAAAGRLGSDWTVVRSGDRRVAVLRGQVPEAARAGVLAALAGARAERPQNRDLDLAHLPPVPPLPQGPPLPPVRR